MGKWGIYNTSLDFFKNLQLGDKIKYNKNNCIIEGEIISINKPIKDSKIMKVTKKTEGMMDCPITINERIMILPSHSDKCEVL